ncbi:MAG: hypothetical protein OXG78_16540, partial [Chloroflexi bacterium]|nr:hypothetical protein [Chloroflexota bacterium]
MLPLAHWKQCHYNPRPYTKAIRNRRGGMQESLESVLRLHDFLRADSSGRSVKTDITKHWRRIDAHKIRKFFVNPWKHEGMLKGENTELTNIPYGFSIEHSVVSGLRDVKPPEVDHLAIKLDPHDCVNMLVSGIDAAYAIFLDDSSPSQQKGWFSPAQCGSGKCCKKCNKELLPCERCEEQLEMVGVEIRCMCDENSKSIREAIRWIRYCERFCADPTFPKRLEGDHFLLSDECLFSSVCREINSALIANLPEPVFYDDGSVGYAAGTYTEEEIRDIMRPLRAEVDKYLARMDTAATLKDVLLKELEGYTGDGLNDSAYLTTNEAEGIYTIVDFATVRGKRLAVNVLVARLVGNRVVIELDRHDKSLADALKAREVSEAQIVLAYHGETA